MLNFIFKLFNNDKPKQKLPEEDLSYDDIYPVEEEINVIKPKKRFVFDCHF